MPIARFSPPKRGFTLVELLVVIAIVATLAGMAVVGTRMALRSAAAGETLNNIRTLGGMMEALADEGLDNGGLNPPGTFPPYEGSLADGTDYVWWDLIALDMGVAEKDGFDIEWNSLPSETQFQNPLSRHKLGGNDRFYGFNSPSDTRGGFAYNALLTTDDIGGSFAVVNIEDGPNTILLGESDDNIQQSGLYFDDQNNAPQGNYKDSAHCYFLGNSVRTVKNTILKDQSSFEFFTTPRDKNYGNQP